MDNGVTLEYEITFGRVEAKIDTPFDIEFKDIKQIYIEQTSDSMKRMSIYPNGLVVFMDQTIARTIIKSNWPIEENSTNQYTIVKP